MTNIRYYIFCSFSLILAFYLIFSPFIDLKAQSANNDTYYQTNLQLHFVNEAGGLLTATMNCLYHIYIASPKGAFSNLTEACQTVLPEKSYQELMANLPDSSKVNVDVQKLWGLLINIEREKRNLTTELDQAKIEEKLQLILIDYRQYRLLQLELLGNIEKPSINAAAPTILNKAEQQMRAYLSQEKRLLQSWDFNFKSKVYTKFPFDKLISNYQASARIHKTFTRSAELPFPSSRFYEQFIQLIQESQAIKEAAINHFDFEAQLTGEYANNLYKDLLYQHNEQLLIVINNFVNYSRRNDHHSIYESAFIPNFKLDSVPFDPFLATKEVTSTTERLRDTLPTSQGISTIEDQHEVIQAYFDFINLASEQNDLLFSRLQSGAIYVANPQTYKYPRVAFAFAQKNLYRLTNDTRGLIFKEALLLWKTIEQIDLLRTQLRHPELRKESNTELIQKLWSSLHIFEQAKNSLVIGLSDSDIALAPSDFSPTHQQATRDLQHFVEQFASFINLEDQSENFWNKVEQIDQQIEILMSHQQLFISQTESSEAKEASESCMYVRIISLAKNISQQLQSLSYLTPSDVKRQQLVPLHNQLVDDFNSFIRTANPYLLPQLYQVIYVY